MDPILTTVVATLLGKCTIAYITETVFGGWLANRGDNVISKQIPNISKRILAQFKDTEKPVNHHLQKAILSSHWLATKIFAEDFKKKNNSPLFQRIIIIADEQLNQLKKEDYQLNTISPDAYEADLLIFKDNESNITEILRNKVIDYHVEILFELLKVKADHPEFIVFQNAINNGLPNENLNWFELACSFLNELLKGENNKAKDAFQNQELAKIAFGVDGLKKELMQGFETLANKYVQGIGEDRFNEFMNWLAEDLREIKGSLNRLEIATTEINNTVKRIEERIIILQDGLQTKELNLNNFPDYRNLLTDIENLYIAFNDKQTEITETIELLAEENDERKRNRFAKDLNNLQQDLLELDNTRTKKQNEFEEFKSNIEKTWLSLYADNVPDSPRLIKARELFETGNLQEANAVLNPQLLQQDYELLKKAKDFLQQKEEILAQEYLTKANFTVLAKDDKNWFTEAKEYYHKAVELHENYTHCFAFAYFLQQHNEILEAIIWYEKALLFSSNIVEKATTLNNLGNLQMAKNDFENASASYQEALDIRRDLARISPQTYLLYVAMTLNNLAVLQRAKNDFATALTSYQEALGIKRELARVNPQTYLPDVAVTLNNLGNLQSDKNDFENAAVSYQEALDIHRELAKVNPQTYLPGVAMTLNNLGNLQRAKNDFENASASYQEALDIRRDLARENPQTYLPYVAITLNDLGNLKSDKNDFETALSSYKEALGIYRDLARENPQTYLPDIATTLNNLAVLQSVNNDFENALSSYEEALGIRRDLARVNPQTYLPDVAMTLNNLAVLQRAQNDFETALASYQEALDIRRDLARINPQTYLPDVAMVLNNLAVLHSDKNDFENAVESYQEALNIRSVLAQQNPNAYQISFAETLINLAIFHLYSVKDKDKSLGLAYHAYINAVPYHQQVPKALQICQAANQVWQVWEEDLRKYLEENQKGNNE